METVLLTVVGFFAGWGISSFLDSFMDYLEIKRCRSRRR